MKRFISRLWRLSLQPPVDSPRQMHKILTARIIILALIIIGILVFEFAIVVILTVLRIP